MSNRPDHDPITHHSLPITASPPTDRRRTLCAVSILAVWAVIAGRLVQVQWLDREHFAASASRQRYMTELLPPRPGEILDRHGRVLATSVLSQSLWVNPSKVEDRRKLAKRIATALKLNPDKLTADLLQHRDRQFLWVKRRLSEEEAKAVRELKMPGDVAGFRDEYRRHYPQGPIAAHVLGLRDIDGVGQGGVEQARDRLLRGTAGRRTMIRDARGRVVELLDGNLVPPTPGKTLRLTLDVVVQMEVEREIDALLERWKPHSAGIIVMDPHTGDLLAMASRPAFDPNDPQNVPPKAWKNINVATVLEPGSTFKPFVVAWALHRGVIQPDEQFHCEHGRYRMGRRILHDHHPYGVLSVQDVLVKSSNIGMAKIGERLTNRGLYAAAVRFGFGRRTGSGLPGEVDGILRPLEQWTSYSTGSIPMGQELAVTPLQLITAHAALANGGRLISPRLVRRVSDGYPPIPPLSKGGQRGVTPPQVKSQTVPPRIARWLVREVMTDVVRRGTGKNARLADYEVFGKTGTAQKIDPKTGRYSHNRHVCSFVCGAPASNPQALVLVVVDTPTAKGVHYGGTVAAPTAARVLQSTLVHLRVPARVASRPLAIPR